VISVAVVVVCVLQCCCCDAVLGTIRLSNIITNSRELPELVARLNISTDEFNQVMNISLNTSKVFELCRAGTD